jgi:hypothetical protein
VIVSDIANDPLWVDFRDAASSHGLRAARSERDVVSVAALQVLRNDALANGVQDQLREAVQVELVLKIAAVGFHGVRADIQ